MKKTVAAVILTLALPAWGQHVTDLHISDLHILDLHIRDLHVTDQRASVVDISAQQALLKVTSNPVLLAAIKQLRSCVATQPIAAPVGRMMIPKHYLSGSNGPVNPAEAEATRAYAAFENRITAGMNQYVATGNHGESACALEQLDIWAKGRALLDYDREESSQAWYQAEWTLSAAGITNSVLTGDATLDKVQQKRVTAWLREAAQRDISFEKPTDSNNNHHYWRGLAATAIGVAASDDKLFRFGVDAYQEAIAEIDDRGAFPREMARHENAIHYQGFALQPLVLIAQFAARQGMDLYSYKAHGRDIRDAILFFGHAVDDPSLIRPYTSDPQAGSPKPAEFAEFNFYCARFGIEGLPPAIVHAIESPTFTTRLGGSTTILGGK